MVKLDGNTAILIGFSALLIAQTIFLVWYLTSKLDPLRRQLATLLRDLDV